MKAAVKATTPKAAAKVPVPKAPAPTTAKTGPAPKAASDKATTSKASKASGSAAKVAGATRTLPGPRSARGRGIPRPSPMAGFDDSGKCITVTFSKSEQIVRLLREKPGLSIAQLMQLTGWQAHSVRGFFSGIIRKKYGLTLNVHLRDGIRHYQIVK